MYKECDWVLKKGECVIYGSHGVCRIEGTETKDIAGEFKEYYVLKPVYDINSTVFVPVNKKTLTDEMKKILTKDEIISVIRKIAVTEVSWIDDEIERKEKCRETLTSSDRFEIIKMIKALYLHGQSLIENKKKPRISDERFFREAERILYEEFAYVLDIAFEDVVGFITNECEKCISA